MTNEYSDKLQEMNRLAIKRTEAEIELLALRVRIIRIHFASKKDGLEASAKKAMETIDDGMLTLRLRTQRFTDAVSFLETYFDIDA